MRWIYALLSLHLYTFGAFANDTGSIFRETIARYGHTDKDSDHSYVESYERLLAPFKDKPCKLLEIGVNFGGSAIMWHNYLRKSKLVLLDNRNVLMPHIKAAMNPNRWRLHVGNAYSPKIVAKMKKAHPNGFDIIIDDGPHSTESQQFVLTYYLPLLKNGGVLIIEDIPDIADLEFLQNSIPESSQFQIEIVDLRHVKGRYDDILFVVKRKDP